MTVNSLICRMLLNMKIEIFSNFSSLFVVFFFLVHFCFAQQEVVRNHNSLCDMEGKYFWHLNKIWNYEIIMCWKKYHKKRNVRCNSIKCTVYNTHTVNLVNAYVRFIVSNSSCGIHKTNRLLPVIQSWGFTIWCDYSSVWLQTTAAPHSQATNKRIG